ncbi:MAG: c-type cytochrome [Bacteroidota bacterium]
MARPAGWSKYLLSALAGLLLAPGLHAQQPDAERVRQLIHLVRQDCGSCHGLTLKGGLGPALTADALRERPPVGLQATILHGRPGTPMPPFLNIVSEAEASWIVGQLLAGFPTEASSR